MKKLILTISVLLGLACIGVSQTKDNVARECVLFELFTGVRCPYCPAAANAVAQMLDEGLAIAPVGYHTSAFSTNLYYTSETNARANYYGIDSYPTLKADGVTGVSGGGSASENMYSYYRTYYNQRISVASPFTIDLSYEPIEGTTCRVNCTVTQVGECSGTNVRVFIALTQCNIDVNWQGMSGLHHVCRDMIPTQTGTVFTGPSMTISETFEMNWPKEDCYLTAWVQNYNGTKEVYQAVRMSTVLDLDYDLVLKEVDEVVTTNCSGAQSPRLTVKNYGTQTVTSFNLCAFDGVEDHCQTWEGSLASGESTTVQMEEFVAAPCEALEFYVTMPNGHEDGFMADNYFNVALVEPSTIDGYVKMQFKTDSNPEETVVQVKDMESGEVVQSFTFELPKHVYTEEFVLPSASCYRISVLDLAGNGLGSGAIFKFTDASNQTLFNGSSATHFTDELALEVYGDGSSTWEVPEQEESRVEIMPNPSDGTFYLNLGEGTWQVTVFDLSGRMVHQVSQFTEGKIALDGCESGMYFLMATDGSKEIVRKLLVY